MRYATICSGIDAPSAAWKQLGWQPVFFSEIDAFPKAVLKERYPEVPDFGDMTKFKEWPDVPVDLICAGTPCQSFSVAGLRKGLDDPRGNLTLTYLAILDRYRPEWVVWENVPGVLSIDKGRVFGAFLGALGQLGYGFAYRILDAQYFGVPQRRRRVFVIGHLGDWRRAAAVLFERSSLRGDPAPSREARESVARPLGGSSQSGGFRTTDLDNQGAFIPMTAWALQERDHKGPDSDTKDGHLIPVLAGAVMRSPTTDRSPNEDSTLIPVAFQSNLGSQGGDVFLDQTGPMRTGTGGKHGNPPAVAFKASHYTRGKDGAPSDIAPPLSKEADRGDQDLLLAFDTTQITHPENRSQPNDLSPQLAAAAHAPTIAFSCKDHGADAGHLAATLRSMSEADGNANAGGQVAVAFADLADPVAANQARTYTREGTNNFRMSNVAHTSMQVRRLTPEECEALQGFPRGYTLITYRGKPAKDGPRYKALGNSMAVPVVKWIGERIAMVEEI